MPTNHTPTDPRDRALEVIDAYGADMRRWPADERATLAATVASDPALRAALAAAERLDTELAEWATAPAHPAAPFDPATLPAQRPLHRWQWAGVGAGVGAVLTAAAAAMVMLVSPPATRSPAPAEMAMASAATPVATDAVAHPAAAGPNDGFAYVFMPTYDEENLI